MRAQVGHVVVRAVRGTWRGNDRQAQFTFAGFACGGRERREGRETDVREREEARKEGQLAQGRGEVLISVSPPRGKERE